MKTLRDSFNKSKYLSIKQDSYFHAYDKVLSRFIGQPITIVEVGVLNGGSLFMWRDYFGEKANIIGVEFNPSAKKWEEHGFKIFIGDQASEEFWANFFKEVGPIDVLIDDGGHTNHQQIATVQQAVHNIRDGGLLIVEDTHTSYMKSFGNPSPYSFISFAKSIVDRIHGRYNGNTKGAKPPAKQIFSVEFFESMTVFSIDRRLAKTSETVTNGGISSNAVDYRFKRNAAERINDKIEESSGLARSVYKRIWRQAMRRQNLALKKYFTKMDV
jgi:hypothetical protein